jgi:hypothetical protein
MEGMKMFVDRREAGRVDRYRGDGCPSESRAGP